MIEQENFKNMLKLLIEKTENGDMSTIEEVIGAIVLGLEESLIYS